MVEANMQAYPLYKLTGPDAYGDYAMEPDGTARISVSLYAQNNTENVLYKDAKYIGLTWDARITDSNIVDFGGELLKVKLVNPFGRLCQLVLGEYAHGTGKGKAEQEA